MADIRTSADRGAALQEFPVRARPSTSDTQAIALIQPGRSTLSTAPLHETAYETGKRGQHLDDSSQATSIDDDDGLHEKPEAHDIVHRCTDTTASAGSHIFNGDAGLRTVLNSRRHDLARSQATHHSSILNGDIGIEEYLVLVNSLQRAPKEA